MTTLLIAAICGLCTSISHAAALYGVAPFEVGSNSNLYRIEPTTGAAMLIGSTGFAQFGGLAFSPWGVLYGYTPGALYTVSTATGAATRVGFLGNTAPEGGLAFHPVSGALFGIESDDDNLLTINVATGAAATVVGPLGAAGRDTSGLTFLADGRLLGIALSGGGDRLIEINPATGAASTIGSLGSITGLPSVGGLEFDPSNGILYYSDATSLYSVNSSSGAATLIGAHGVSGMSGLAVPEPAGFAVLAVIPIMMRQARVR